MPANKNINRGPGPLYNMTDLYEEYIYEQH
jgi:hypothetical protein